MKGGLRFDQERKELWRWTLMVMQPEFITGEMVSEAAEQTSKKDLPALKNVQFERSDEGSAVQVLHIGPYAEEAPTIEKLHNFAKEQGYKLHGKHHEIYLSDPRRAAPEKLKTILRHPAHFSHKPSVFTELPASPGVAIPFFLRRNQAMVSIQFPAARQFLSGRGV